MYYGVEYLLDWKGVVARESGKRNVPRFFYTYVKTIERKQNTYRATNTRSIENQRGNGYRFGYQNQHYTYQYAQDIGQGKYRHCAACPYLRGTGTRFFQRYFRGYKLVVSVSNLDTVSKLETR